MADKTGIEWTDATWNPIVGCAIVSKGCTNCYAMKVAQQMERRFGSEKYTGLTKIVNGNAVWTGEVRLIEDILDQPLRWKKPRRIFVNSMSDLFHESVPDEAIDKIFAVMALAPQHNFQVLTKRDDRMYTYLSNPATRRRIYEKVCEMAIERQLDVVLIAEPDHEATAPAGRRIALSVWPLRNVWLGVSVEDQEAADSRIPILLATPAFRRYLSCEPLLGPVDLNPYLYIFTHDDVAALECGCSDQPLPFRDPGTTDPKKIATPRLDWVIAGGESGPNARPMHPDWARALRDQCADAGVPFFFKQWGEFRPHSQYEAQDSDLVLEGQHMIRVGKKAAGALLDGREHKEFPA